MIYLLPLITAFAGHLRLAVTKREMQPPVIQLIRDSCSSTRPAEIGNYLICNQLHFTGMEVGLRRRDPFVE